jgi:hypothetical protein
VPKFILISDALDPESIGNVYGIRAAAERRNHVGLLFVELKPAGDQLLFGRKGA